MKLLRFNNIDITLFPSSYREIVSYSYMNIKKLYIPENYKYEWWNTDNNDLVLGYEIKEQCNSVMDNLYD